MDFKDFYGTIVQDPIIKQFDGKENRSLEMNVQFLYQRKKVSELPEEQAKEIASDYKKALTFGIMLGRQRY